jgi:hypothetical protein
MNPQKQTEPGCDNSHQKYLVVLTTRRNRIIGIHSPRGNNISIGRSSESHIHVEDPYFPRFAGEVILKPAPLIRTPGSGSDGNRVQQITPGRPIRLSPYQLHLLEEGDIMRNRLWHQQKKRQFRKYPIQWIFSAVIITAIVLLWGFSPPEIPYSQEKPKALTVPFEIEGLLVEIPRKSEPNFEIRDAQLSTPSGKQKKIKIAEAISEKPVRKSLNEEVLSEESFTRTLELAADYLAKGDGIGAGGCISSTQTLLSQEQLEQLKSVLEPLAEKMYRRAYILRSFDGKESDRIFRELSDSGLEMLPSVVKAGRMRSRE